jgi:hypothetical protein
MPAAFSSISDYIRSEKIAELQTTLITLQQQQIQQRVHPLTTTPSAPTGPPPTTVRAAIPAALQVRCSVRDDFGRWVQMCGLNRWIQMELWDANPDEHTWGRIPLLGMTDPIPHLDSSTHGREYEGLMHHGTCLSQLPNILSTGVVLRSAVPTRGLYAVWAAEEIKRALDYSPPVKLNQVEIQ